MRRLVLLRHGETDHNVAKRAQGQLDVPLNDRGLAQARAVAPVVAGFRPDFVWSSDLQRARRTAEIVADLCGLEVRTDARFREFAVGDNREDRTWTEYQEAFAHEAETLQRTGMIPGRESPEQVADRWRPALSEAAAAVPWGGCGVVVAHGAALRTGVLEFLGLPGSAAHALGAMNNCGWTVLEETPPIFREHGDALRWRLAGWNRTLG